MSTMKDAFGEEINIEEAKKEMQEIAKRFVQNNEAANEEGMTDDGVDEDELFEQAVREYWDPNYRIVPLRQESSDLVTKSSEVLWGYDPLKMLQDAIKEEEAKQHGCKR